MRRLMIWSAVVAVVVVGALAGAAGLSARTGALRTGSSAQTFTVNVDGANKAANEDFLAYFPSVVRVHAGDTVVFHEVGNGEPHTATLGTFANDAVAAFEALTPKQQQGQPPASVLQADAKVPSLFPQGPGDAVQVAANPCLGESAVPSTNGLCPETPRSADFTGREAYYNSGWLNSGAKFTVHLSSSMAPGVYRFLCALHREGMTGRIVVVPASTPVASPAVQYAAGQKRLARLEAQLQRAVNAERQGKPPIPVTLPGKATVLAGSGQPGISAGAGIAEFGPKVLKVPVGGYVIWYVIGIHSITFASNKTNNDIRAVAPDGTVHINQKAVAPAGGPGEPGHVSGGSGKGITFKVVAESTWNGRGFHSSGVFGNSFPPLIEGYRIRFTRAGTYNYICTVHDHMKGTIVVG
jgi:plastocyanin